MNIQKIKTFFADFSLLFYIFAGFFILAMLFIYLEQRFYPFKLPFYNV